ncbi:hypothetical protein EDB92DRAFT_1944876 [Lactarius akahatsu]|uniref:Uncharacterized protein n=1 Tax=Lactarius akahatsu TaxID=416441 RepID=A0AAD4LI03_9AGAM|nr:hypothetical protein EDB92DRAFT_1944876 [Lactarius akahatsu]
MSQVETYRIYFSTGPASSTILYAWNACLEDFTRSLASPAYRRAVRGISNARSPAPKDEDNIMAALKQSGRVSSISLTVTSSLRERFYAIEGPFSELEDLVLRSQDDMQQTLPSTFWWGPRLRSLHLTRIALPALPQLLYSSRDLVDIQLHDIVRVAYLSPEELANGLSGMSQLRSLSLRHPSSVPHLGIAPWPSSSAVGERVTLPALTHLKFRGTSGFLSRFMDRISSPLLADI